MSRRLERFSTFRDVFVKLNRRFLASRVLQLSGLVVGGIGIWTVAAKHSYVSLMSTSTYPTLAYALIVAGVLAVIGSWLGCGGVTSENRCVLLVFKCCGALRFEDWLVSEWHKDEEVLKNGSVVPDSCCKTPTLLCGKRDHPSNIQYTGCIYKFLETTKDHLIILGAVGLGLSVLELFGIVLGSCLYIKLRHDFDD
ncbi:hypothetical protein P5V15_002391 [Pogonomyrmex californicus]